MASESVVEAAMWAGDVDRLHEIAPCRCCCADHTFEGCPAREWCGCRGQNATPKADRKAWAAHYARFHGLPPEEF